MAAAQGAITSAASGRGGTAAIGSEVNRRLCHENPMGLFVTCVLATVDLNEGVVEYVCAGHEPAVIVQADGSRRVLPMTGGLAMGIIDDFEYDMRREKLHVGETLFLYTDGLTDAVNLDGELFGKDRLEATLDDATTGVELIAAVNDDITRMTGDATYDTVAFYETASARGATVVVPPAKTACVSPRGPRSSVRDRTINTVKRIGRCRWKKTSRYQQQARVENACSRYKSIIGDGLRAKTPGGRTAETLLACNILNTMTAMGRPNSYAMGR